MSEIINLANVVLLIACMYFGFTYGFAWWIIVLMILALISWAYYGFTKERKRLLEAQIRLYEAEAEYYERKK